MLRDKFALMAFLNSLDYLTTRYLVTEGYKEQNPLVNRLMESGWYEPVKLSATLFFNTAALVYAGEAIDVAEYVMTLVCAVYFVIVVNNIMWVMHSIAGG